MFKYYKLDKNTGIFFFFFKENVWLKKTSDILKQISFDILNTKVYITHTLC